MTTAPRKPRKTTRKRSALRDEFSSDLADLTRATDRRDSGSHKTRTPSTERDEYRAALADLNRYSAENETAEALAARERLDNAELAARRRWWRL